MNIDAERLVRDAWTPGRSVGAAARDVASDLRSADRGSLLAVMLEAMLADNNRQANHLARAKRAVRWLLHSLGERPCPSGAVSMPAALALANAVLALERPHRPDPFACPRRASP